MNNLPLTINVHPTFFKIYLLVISPNRMPAQAHGQECELILRNTGDNVYLIVEIVSSTLMALLVTLPVTLSITALLMV